MPSLHRESTDSLMYIDMYRQRDRSESLGGASEASPNECPPAEDRQCAQVHVNDLLLYHRYHQMKCMPMLSTSSPL